MTGIEVASLVLGVLPVLFSAAENFDRCLRPFNRYRNFALELDRYQRLLKLQKTIYHNQCLSLLDSALDHDVAVRMLFVSGHPSWVDQDLDSRLLTSLGSSKDSCLDVVNMITECLRDIENESQDLGSIISQNSSVGISSHGLSVNPTLIRLRYSGPAEWRQSS